MKRIISCLVMLCLVLSLTGCSSGKDEKWEKAYRDYCEEENLSGKFTLVDIDADDIPELFVISTQRYAEDFSDNLC